MSFLLSLFILPHESLMLMNACKAIRSRTSTSVSQQSSLKASGVIYKGWRFGGLCQCNDLILQSQMLYKQTQWIL